MKTITQLIGLSVLLWALGSSCDKNEHNEHKAKIELISITLRNAEETTVVIEAVLKNFKDHDFGFVLCKSDLNEILNRNTCHYIKINNNLTDTIKLELEDLDASTSYICVLYYVENGDSIFDVSRLTFTTKEFVTISFDTIYDIENNAYRTINIGEQKWMADNLRTTTFNNGGPITNLISNEQWYYDSIGGYCWYDNNIDFKETIGAIYSGYLIETEKLCPAGWRIPSDKDWSDLITYLIAHGFKDSHAAALKSDFGWTENLKGDNHYGFTALPSGYRDEVGGFYDRESYAAYWSTDKNHLNQYSLTVLNTNNKVKPMLANRNAGFSIRCIKD